MNGFSIVHLNPCAPLQLTSEAAAELGLPPLIQNFHSLCPLEDLPLADEQPSVSLGIRTCVIKGVSMVDGAAYGLRRIDGRQVLPSPGLLKSAHETVQRWSCVANHPNAVGLRGVFASSEYGGVSSLYFVHDYHPGAVSLHFRHLQSQRPASEDELWSYLTQLAAVTRVAHSSGLAFRPECLIPSKVLLTSGGRLRVGSIGILDVLDGERVQNEDLTVLQRRDLLGVGKLILSLATVGCEMGVGPLDHCGLHYSVELVRLINSLMMASEGNHLSSWQHLAGALSERSLAALDSANMHNDALLHELAKEVENGRLLRLLVKLGLINERPGGNFSVSEVVLWCYRQLHCC
ncbi:unnamed protein product [Ostreobium quekettii]|uniref:Pan3 C-terminal knob domain-containing protein n=1 Tax=Ostreobium quekettii TaxID=121088 RepID=A0A8S1ILC2_9CHLO|nr:unnamed protein product [Ostreobium quekettii]